jgi:signal transduction histidine kinase
MAVASSQSPAARIDENPDATRSSGFSPRPAHLACGTIAGTVLTRRQLTGLTVAAAGLVPAAVLVQLLADVPEPETVLRMARGPVVNIVNGSVWLGVGLFALWRRPDNPLGLIMAAVGAAILLPWVVGAAGSLGFTVAVFIDDVSPVIGAHAFLAFPTGRLPGRAERLVLAVGYLAAVAFAGAEVLFRDYAECTTCPDNLALIDADAEVADAIVVLARAIALGTATALVMILALRWRAATPAARRVLAPVLWTSVAVAALFAFTYAVGPSDEATTKVTGIAVAAIPLAFLAGLLRTRLHRSAVGDLVVELAAPHSPAQLRDVLARAVGDPSLELMYWLPETEHFVDTDGHPVAAPSANSGRAVSIIEHDGAPLAALSYDASLLEEPELIAAVGAAARLALENSRLQAELRAQLVIVRDSRARIVAAGDVERRRIERNLHDGAQQRLLAVRLALRLARKADGEALERQLEAVDAELAEALDELRALARGLHPPILTEQGLGPALGTLARRAAIPVDVSGVEPDRMPAAAETAAYYVAAEGLANVVKHAGASYARIAVTRFDGRAVVEVVDDGSGRADPNGSGLRGLRDRVEALGGGFTIHSVPGSGTTLRAELPCE